MKWDFRDQASLEYESFEENLQDFFKKSLYILSKITLTSQHPQDEK